MKLCKPLAAENQYLKTTGGNSAGIVKLKQIRSLEAK
jgi:hypothetical protein